MRTNIKWLNLRRSIRMIKPRERSRWWWSSRSCQFLSLTTLPALLSSSDRPISSWIKSVTSSAMCIRTSWMWQSWYYRNSQKTFRTTMPHNCQTYWNRKERRSQRKMRGSRLLLELTMRTSWTSSKTWCEAAVRIAASPCRTPGCPSVAFRERRLAESKHWWKVWLVVT